MKKKLIIALSVALALAILVGGSVAIASRYNQYKHNKIIAAQNETKVREKAQAEQAAFYKTLQAKYDAERIECEKGRAIFETLTPVVQKKVAAPVCGPAVVR